MASHNDARTGGARNARRPGRTVVHTRGGRHPTAPSHNRLLTSVGLSLLATSVVGFFLRRSEPMVGGFLMIGAALVFLSVVVPRLEGSQEISLTGAKITVQADRMIIPSSADQRVPIVDVSKVLPSRLAPEV